MNEDDILIGGTGDDFLAGYRGDDIYVFGRASGNDTLTDERSSSAVSGHGDDAEQGGDSILFEGGITIDDLVLRRDGDDMVIHVADQLNMDVLLSADEMASVRVTDWNVDDRRIEWLRFSDGMDFDVSAITNTRLGADLLGAATVDAVDDSLAGTGAGDWMDGFAGDDTLLGGDGADYLFGRDGRDSLMGEDGDDILSGGGGRDRIIGGHGNDVVTGGADKDVLHGQWGDDYIAGGSGDDYLHGGQGNDVLDGGSGDDFIRMSYGNDRIVWRASDGNDTLGGIDTDKLEDKDILYIEGVVADAVWFDRIEDDLVIRVHGSADVFQFQEWWDDQGRTEDFISHIVVDDAALAVAKIDRLLDAMAPHVGELSDGTSAHDEIQLGETPDEVQRVIDNNWTF